MSEIYYLLARRRMWQEQFVTDCQRSFKGEKIALINHANKFTLYFLAHSTSEGVLFKTIKEIAADMEIGSVSLLNVLDRLMIEEVIYRRKGLIGVRKITSES